MNLYNVYAIYPYLTTLCYICNKLKDVDSGGVVELLLKHT